MHTVRAGVAFTYAVAATLLRALASRRAGIRLPSRARGSSVARNLGRLVSTGRASRSLIKYFWCADLSTELPAVKPYVSTL